MSTTQDRSTNRIALVTGASRGLGKSAALHLAEGGVDVVLTYRAGAKEAREVASRIEAVGRRAAVLPLDVGDSRSFAAFAEALKAELGRVWQRERFDFLVNNAGTSHHNSIENTTEAEFDALYNVHLKGVFFLTQKLLPLINDGGRIVNLSSGLTRIIMPGSAPYGSMKGAVETLTKYMAKELGPRRIAVNVVAPGAIETDFSGGMVRDNPALNKHIAGMTALGRVGLPDDIGPMIASLLSEDNRWVNAQRVEASGGMSI
jgi:NAD(P)-dependent dehydrogenase (short-subunit alcohol dehydrogenase family)